MADTPDGKGEEQFSDPNNNSWPTLGAADSKFFTTDEEGVRTFARYPFARLGFALASPLLLLREGKRVITVEIPGDPVPDLADFLVEEYVYTNNALQISLSGEKEWIMVEEWSPDAEQPFSGPSYYQVEQTDSGFQIQITLEAGIPPITFADPKVLKEDFGTSLPLIRIELNQNSDRFLSLYREWINLIPVGLKLKVEVSGVRDLVLHDDLSPLKPGSPIRPFGILPKVGNSFFIGSQEVFLKNWDALKINFDWDTVPEESFIKALYRPYLGEKSLDIDQIVTQVDVLQFGKWNPGDGSIYRNPFTVPDCTPEIFQNSHYGLCLDRTADKTSDLGLQKYGPEAISEEITLYDVRSTDGFLRLQINDKSGARSLFLHEDFAAIKERQVRAAAALQEDKKLRVVDAVYQVRKDDEIVFRRYPHEDILPEAETIIAPIPADPFTPLLKQLSIDYTASADLDDLDYFHLRPFGNRPAKDLEATFLFPDFPDDGYLYIGLEDLTPGGSLSLLFQLKESTVNGFLPPATIKWHYLKNNNFSENELRPDVEVLSDDTRGLVRSGIIRFSLPSDINADNTLLPKGMYWLRATSNHFPSSVAETVKIHANALEVTYAPTKKNNPNRVADPLPAKSITQAVQNLPGIRSLMQPYPSFGGRLSEKQQAENFNIRASEHLRHKGRAITLFDYERLVLQEFPEIFKVKAINHTLGRNVGLRSQDYHLSPGFITLAVIPQLNAGSFSLDSLIRPRATAAKLKAIQNYLKELISPFIRLRVLNPDYQSIQVDTTVKFRPGKSNAFYKRQLQLDITRFLSPWAFGDLSRIEFGGKVYRSDMVNFIERLEYVDYIVRLDMRKATEENPKKVLEATGARSILVSGLHIVNPHEKPCCLDCEEEVPDPGPAGLGNAIVGKNFVVS